MIAAVPVPPHIEGQARAYAETHGLAEAAADYAVFLVRIYHQPAAESPGDQLVTAIAIRELWQRHVAGTASGLVGVTVMPPMTPGQWLKAAQSSLWAVATPSQRRMRHYSGRFNGSDAELRPLPW